MDKQHPYNNIIEDKLAQLPDADAEQLWNGMQAILDKKMPQQKDKRRFLGWLATHKALLLMGAASIILVCFFAFIYSSTAKTISNNNLSKLNTSVKPTTPSATTAPSPPRKKDESFATSLHTAQTNNAAKESTTSSNNFTNQNTEKATIASLPSVKQSYISLNRKKNGFADNYTIKNQLGREARSQPNNSNVYTEAFPQTGNEAPVRLLHTASINQVISKARDFPKPLVLDDSAYPNPLRKLFLQQNAAAAKSIKQNNNDKGPYVGILVGVDLSSVQFQSMKTGVNKGFVAGYELSKRWSIESGLFWNKKRYAGEGSTFHPSGYTLPAGVKMLSVNGECQMYEWPVNVKFTIISKKNSLFVTAGLSSYYMKTESYNYEYEQNGQSWKSYASYKNETKDWFSVGNFSLGYTYRIGARSSIRVEPYLKLPIRDIGINNMPVVSTGLNVGFTKQILR